MKLIFVNLVCILFLINCKNDDPEPIVGNCEWVRNHFGLRLLDVKYNPDPACQLGKVAKVQNQSTARIRYQICFKLNGGGWDTYSGVLDPREIEEVSSCENSSIINYQAIDEAGNSACKLPSCDY